MWINSATGIGGADWNVNEFESMIREKLCNFFRSNFVIGIFALRRQACSNGDFCLVLVKGLL